MMKGMITKATNKETDEVMKEFVDKLFTKRGIIFVEKKKPKPTIKGPKIRHMVESSKKMQKDAAKKSKSSEEKIVNIDPEPVK